MRIVWRRHKPRARVASRNNNYYVALKDKIIKILEHEQFLAALDWWMSS
jgi:hypothetical protein